MDLQLAQSTKVVHVPKLLSLEEIELLHKTAASVWRREAVESRATGHTAAHKWNVLYLQTNNWFQTLLPDLYDKCMRTARKVDAEHWGQMKDLDPINVRCAEYHKMSTGGALAEKGHYDAGSLVTLDIMLTKPGRDFQGGVFHTCDGKDKDSELTPHPYFDQGDAVLFVSHKAHHVHTVTHGTRQVFVIEYWNGIACQCPHRCESAWAPCGLTVENSRQQEQAEFEEAFFGALDMDLLGSAMQALKTEEEEEQQQQQQQQQQHHGDSAHTGTEAKGAASHV